MIKLAKLFDFLWRFYAFGVAIYLVFSGRLFESAVLMCLWSTSICLAGITLKYIKDEPHHD